MRGDPFAPPPPSAHGVGPDLLRALVRRGLLVGRHGVWFAADAPDRAAARIRAVAGEQFTLADARDALGTSRRVTLARARCSTPGARPVEPATSAPSWLGAAEAGLTGR